MISPDAKPIFNDPPYKRIDPARPGLKKFILYEEWDWQGRPAGPDPYLYRWDDMNYRFELKEGV